MRGSGRGSSGFVIATLQIWIAFLSPGFSPGFFPAMTEAFGGLTIGWEISLLLKKYIQMWKQVFSQVHVGNVFLEMFFLILFWSLLMFKFNFLSTFSDLSPLPISKALLIHHCAFLEVRSQSLLPKLYLSLVYIANGYSSKDLRVPFISAVLLQCRWMESVNDNICRVNKNVLIVIDPKTWVKESGRPFQTLLISAFINRWEARLRKHG